MINARSLEFLFRIRLCESSLRKIVLLCLIVFSSQSFSQLANGHDKYLGNASDPPLPASYDTNWNQLTPGNAGKWGSVESARDVYNWTPLDQAYNYSYWKRLCIQGSYLSARLVAAGMDYIT